MVGQTISHYIVADKLGEGGMGVVFKAHDTKLDRIVALKFMHSHIGADKKEKERFINEARAASALDHPNICTIYEINETAEGQLYIVMPAYDGIPLHKKIEKGPLRIDEAIDIAIQVADGLQVAHERGIVHRDIKSSNIFITSRAQVKVMDFGLAYKSDRIQITGTGTTVGTIPYISPEQIRGDQLDHRTDIWSFGVILYEMITGQLPFKSNYSQEILYMILGKAPIDATSLRPDIMAELDIIITNTLRKNRDDRYQNVESLISDLRALKKKRESIQLNFESPSYAAKILRGRYRHSISIIVFGILAFFLYTLFSPTSKEIHKDLSIAVLPFEYVSPDPEGAYFADGIHNDIVTNLSKIEGLRVISYSSAQRYAIGDWDIAGIGRELGVRAILEGDLHRDESRMRLRVRLIDVRDGAIRRTETYERGIEHIFIVQNEITQIVARELGLSLSVSTGKTSIRQPTQNIAAYELYLRGSDPALVRTNETTLTAKEVLKQAIALDSTYADAYAYLSMLYLRLSLGAGDIVTEQLRDWLDLAEHYALKAITLNDSLSGAYLALGIVRWNMFEFALAESLFLHAIALEPSRALTHEKMVNFYIRTRKPEQALGAAKRAMELDPLSPAANAEYARALAANGHCDEALLHLEKLKPLQPPLLRAGPIAARCYAQMGMWQEAIAEMRQALAERTQRGHAFLGYLLTQAGFEEEAMAIHYSLLDKWREGTGDSIALAIMYIGMGDLDNAFSFIEQSLNDFSMSPAKPEFSILDPFFEDLHSDPRFEQLLEEFGIKNWLTGQS
jgi:eukaryotic-like serine/threonine-protein kinase